MYSIGDLIDKLVIENIKLFNIREKLHTESLNDEEYAKLHTLMIGLNKNRGIIADILDLKVEKVVSGQEQNRIIKKIKTY